MHDAMAMTPSLFPSLQEPEEPLGSRALKFAVVLLVHGVLLAWLFEQQIVAVRDAVLMRMDVRVIEPPPLEKPKPLPPKPKVAAPPPVAPPPVMTAAPSTAPSIGGFAVAPQPPVPREAPAAAATAPAPPSPAPVVVAAPAPVVTAARFDADYLNNPPPVYPAQSRRLREEGQVLLMVHVSADGAAMAVHVRQGSGFERLDEAALAAVRQWRFVPARRGHQAIAATVLVPIVFTLKAV
jgi:protein TonB